MKFRSFPDIFIFVTFAVPDVGPFQYHNNCYYSLPHLTYLLSDYTINFGIIP